MSLKIVHADADVGVAKSLAGFLKSQSVPVELQSISSSVVPLAGDVVLALWSRGFKSTPTAAATIEELGAVESTRHIIVKLDKEKLPAHKSAFHVLDASRVGSREKGVWREIAKLGKLAVASGKSYNREAKEAYLKKPVATAYPETDLAEAFQPVPEQKLAKKKKVKAKLVAKSTDDAEGLGFFVTPVVTLALVILALCVGTYLLHPAL